MKVYRGSIQHIETKALFPIRIENGIWYDLDGKRTILQPNNGDIIHTGLDFQLVQLPNGQMIKSDTYYRVNMSRDIDMSIIIGTPEVIPYIILQEITQQEAQANAIIEVIDIMEWQYNGKDMGERSVTATIKFPTPIDFRIGDYIDIPMQSLLRHDGYAGTVDYERFYIYTQPVIEKNARPMSAGDAFIHNVTFYPPQYELTTVLMRDIIQQQANLNNLIYTGFDNVTFYGGAYELLERCMACLKERGLVDNSGNALWSYDLADEINEQKNTALERYTFSFNGNSVADAIAKLADKDYINTKFVINGRKIYVGYKRPYFCKVDTDKDILPTPLKLMYGKTSHQSVALDHGGLYKITKSPSTESPITKLFAYGAARNLNRYYCADRIQSGRYVKKLMLPSFENDGTTDYILSEDGIAKFGIREGKKDFDDIYPSLRYMTYADIRGIKYCIKIKYNGLSDDQFNGKEALDKSNSITSYAVARVQCYKVVPNTTSDVGTVGTNKLVECAPPEDLAVFIHATGKVVKCIIYADKNGKTAKERQIEHDYYVPCRLLDDLNNRTFESYIPGSCFAVHDPGWADVKNNSSYTAADRENWFKAPTTATTDSQSELHRIEYVDTFWATDLYVFQSYNQTTFQRDGYSLWAYPRLNNQYQFAHDDSLLVNELVGVEPIVIVDTSSNQATRQLTWDIYLRDIGFAIDEQNDFGDMVFVVNGTVTVSLLDGLLAGREFTIDGSELNDFQSRCLCAYNEDGTLNSDFFLDSGYTDQSIPQRAYNNGAIWRIRLNRKNDDENDNFALILPAKTAEGSLEAKAGDHIVLLDIYMPDIYIHAAENRLLREATKYLERNSRSNTGYAVDFDKVRFQQIPNYALQMREGLNLRVVDNDLDITTENYSRYLVQPTNGIRYSSPLYRTEQIQTSSLETTTIGTPAIGQDTTTEEYRKGWTHKDWSNYLVQNQEGTSDNKTVYQLEFILPRTNATSDFKEIILHKFQSPQYTRASQGGNAEQMKEFHLHLSIDDKTSETRIRFASPTQAADGALTWTVGLQLSEEWGNIYSKVFNVYQGRGNISRLPIQIEYTEHVLTNTTRETSVVGKAYNAICKSLIDFKRGKTYNVVIDCDETYIPTNKDDIQFLLINNIGAEYTFVPEYATMLSASNKYGFKRLTLVFALDESFNDSIGYYPAIKYIATGEIVSADIYLISVEEKDVDVNGRIINYVDMIAESVTIKVQDNTRSDDRRIMALYPEPIREVRASLKESSNASAWTNLQQEIQETSILTEKNIKTYEALAQYARRNYTALLSLKDSIFDPDGTCSQTFLQVMMLQVGADSMNYQLEKTYQTVGGICSNYYVGGIDDEGKANDRFEVFGEDKLHHFVYTQGSQAGLWSIPLGINIDLLPETDGTYPTYFICLKCLKDGSTGEWIVSTKQYAVNDSEDTTCWYFNWGILSCPDQDGRYTLRETRGNAYMYGDNLICGKISTLAGNSYFDLTHGNFVLSQGTEGDAALSYIDGVLTIQGVNDGSENSILARLGLLEDGKIGGENLIDYQGQIQGYGYIPLATDLRADTDYILSWTDCANRAGMQSQFNICLKIAEQIPVFKQFRVSDTNVEWKFKTPNITSDTISICLFASTAYSLFTFTDLMLQMGTRKTTYQPYVEHITNAIKGSTEIAGGLHMTNVLMLKDENGNVKSGMSGLKDDGDFTYEKQVPTQVEIVETTTGESHIQTIYTTVEETGHSEGVTLWSGGTYQQALEQAQGLVSQLASFLPILLTKTGIGSNIGCFRVESATAVSVIGYNGDKILFESNDNGHPSISVYDNDTLKVKITSAEISGSQVPIYNFVGFKESDLDITKGIQINRNEDNIIENKSLTQRNYYANSYCYVRIKLYGDAQNYGMSDVSLSFDLYIGSAKIGTITSSESSVSGSQVIVERTLLTLNGTNVSGNDLIAKNLVCTAIYGGRMIEPIVRLQCIRFGGNDVDADNYSTLEIRGEFDEQTIIGSNGLSINSQKSGVCQILNNKGELYFRMAGLPNSANDSGQLYLDKGELKIR